MSIDEIRRHLVEPESRVRAELGFGLADCGLDDDLEEDPAEVEAAWAAEIERRVEEIRNGTVETYALEDVLAEMEERYG